MGALGFSQAGKKLFAGSPREITDVVFGINNKGR